MAVSHRHKRHWVRHEQVRAEVVDIPSPGHLLVDIEGFLFRVANRSLSNPQEGDILMLQVQAVDPLELRIVGGPGFVRLA